MISLKKSKVKHMTAGNRGSQRKATMGRILIIIMDTVQLCPHFALNELLLAFVSVVFWSFLYFDGTSVSLITRTDLLSVF